MVGIDWCCRIVMKIQDVLAHPFLRQLYLLSLVLADDASKIYFSEKGSWDSTTHKWCIMSRMDWKRMNYTREYVLVYGFSTNPLHQCVVLSRSKNLKRFWSELQGFEVCNAFPSYFYYRDMPFYEDLVDEYIYKEIECELEEIEDEVYNDPLLVAKKFKVIQDRFGLTSDLMSMIFI